MMLTKADVVQQAAAHTALGGGETCGSATVIGSLPFDDTGSTAGASDDYLSSCAWAVGGPDEVYAFTPASDMAVNVSLCGSSFDTVLIIYEGNCSGAEMACDDDGCEFAGPSQLLGVPLTGGTTYYFVVDGCFDISSGDYQIAVEEVAPPPPPPSCPSTTVYSQCVSPPDAWSSAYTSEQTPAYWVADNFSGVPESICGLRWWGLNALNTTGWTSCVESDDTFEIKFYQDAAGAPGAEVCSYTLTADKVSTGLIYGGFELYEYAAELPSCCTLASGWVSIQGLGSPDCWFLWLDSPDGDGLVYQEGVGFFANDVAFCLLGADSDGDGVLDGDDDCPDTAPGDPVDANGCSTADDDGDGVLNDQDACPDTPDCAVVDADGCPLDGDNDGVADGCDDCPGTAAGDPVDADGCSTADDDGDGVLNDDDLCADTPTCATNVDANGCAIDSDGDGNVDGCEPPAQEGGCCGATGPVAPLGLAVGLLLLGRVNARRRRGC